MNSFKSWVIAILAAASACFGALAWRQHLELVALRAESQRIQVRSAAKAFEAAQVEQGEKTLQAKLDAAQRDEGAALATAVAAVARSKHEHTEINLVECWLAAMNDSQILRLTAIRQRGGIARDYAAFFRKLNLTPGQIDQMTNLLLANQECTMDAAVGAVRQDVNPLENPGQFGDLVKALHADVESQLKALLGGTGYSLYQDYNQAQAQQSVVKDLQQQLGATDAPLSEGQAQLLQEVMAQTKTDQITDNIVDLSRRFLTDPQIQALEGIRQEQQATAQLESRQAQVLQDFGSAIAGRP